MAFENLRRQFEDLASSLAKELVARMREEMQGLLADTSGPARVTNGAPKALAAPKATRRGIKRDMSCRMEGCENVSKGPRYSFLCEKHFNLPKAEKQKVLAAWKEKHG